MALPASYLALRKRLLLRIGIAAGLLIATAATVIAALDGRVVPSLGAPSPAHRAQQPVQASTTPIPSRSAVGAADNANSLEAALREITLPESVDGKAFEVLVQRPVAGQADSDVAQAVAEESTPAAPAKLPRGPHLQVGIFAQPANAEDLKTKLEAQGFPVYIETRVQVGPFAHRKEADKAREKLKAMGMATIFIAQ